MYKDKDKQREANRKASKRYRDQKLDIMEQIRDMRKQGMTKGMTAKVEQGMTKPKRGKDIKCFKDLPADVQGTIDMMSIVDGKIDQTIKAKRTAIAINYQHLFPGRYYSTGSGAERPWERDGQETYGKTPE